MSLLHNGLVGSSMVAGSQPPSLARKMGIQLEHTEGGGVAKHSLGVWHINTGSVISFPLGFQTGFFYSFGAYPRTHSVD